MAGPATRPARTERGGPFEREAPAVAGLVDVGGGRSAAKEQARLLTPSYYAEPRRAPGSGGSGGSGGSDGGNGGDDGNGNGRPS